jgi:hypothetical protein
MKNDSSDSFLRRAAESSDTTAWLFLVSVALLLGIFVGRAGRPRVVNRSFPRTRNTVLPAGMVPGRRRLTHQLPPGANDYGELE